jgi:uncharacterized protein (TIGR04255 family)
MGQKLKNPPVCLVLAQLRFNQVVSISEAELKQIANSFEKLGFVDFKNDRRKHVRISFSSEEGGKVDETEYTARYLFGNKSADSNLVLDLDSLTMETSNYQTSETFFEKFTAAIEAVHEVRPIAFCTRTGLRFVDAIQPSSGRSIEDYVQSHLLGFAQLNAENSPMHYTFTQSQFGVIPKSLVVKSMQSLQGFVFPEDIAQAQQRLTFPTRFTQGGKGPTFMLDSDSSVEQRSDYDKRSLLITLQELKVELTRVFKFATTEWARTDGWN